MNPGQLMANEIAEQPSVWQRFLSEGMDQIEKAKARIAEYSPRFVQFVARGTSDHAALYAKYLVEVHHQLPAGLVSPSSITVYGAMPKLQDVLFVAVSQSGGSPDLVKSVEVARAQGALTLAVTNNPDSPLAAAAEIHIDVLAGPELSVAATKTYTAELLALYELFVGGDASALPTLGVSVLANDSAVVNASQRYRFAQRLITTGRGYSYPTAREAALKLMETSYLSAQAFSGADLLHGPLATVDPQVPVIAIVPNNAGGRAMAPVLERLEERHADILRVGENLPMVSDALSPLLEILPLQQLALHLAIIRGGNPDEPRGLFKVTETL
jgi:glucosamine--fructose-6-phosphate aminotransferase (isomerizing)